MYWHLEGGSNSQFDVSNALEAFYFAKVSNTARIATVLPEIFAWVLFSLNFAVGVGPCNLSSRNFCRTRKFWLHGIYCHLHHACTWCDFLHTVELLLCSSFSFLDKLLAMSLLRYLQPVPNKRQGPKWVCIKYCTHVESSYLTTKLASSNLLFVERSVCEANSR